MTTGLLTPNATDIEKLVLGAMMIEPNRVNELLSILRSEQFYDDRHQHIFKAIEKLTTANNPVDIATVTQQCKRDGTLSKITPQYVSSLANNVVSGGNSEYHARIITEKYLSRKIIDTCVDLSGRAYDNESPLELINTLENRLTQLNEAVIGKEYEDNFDKSVNDVFNAIVNVSKHELTGIPTGQTKLDEITGGFNKTDFIILCARPGMGKSTRALAFVKKAAMENKKVAFFSLEMSREQLIKKMMIEASNVYSNKIMHHELTDFDIGKLTEAREFIKTLPIYINERSSITCNYLRNICRERKRKFGLDMVVIDYLQLMRPNEHIKGQSEERIIAEISMSLKAIAKDLQIPIIALAQLNRDLEKRMDKRPIKADLRHSGQLEQDADLILGLYRPSQYYEWSEDKEYNSECNEDDYKRISEMLILKNRHGDSEIRIKERFIGELSRFEEQKQYAEQF